MVAVHARDNSFQPEQTYDGFRNASIENYFRAIEHLLGRGYWVFRLGDAATPALALAHGRLIDLPRLPDYQDNLDICVIHDAAFSITCSSGPEAVCRMLGAPMLTCNSYPQIFIPLNRRDLMLFKPCRDSATDQLLSYRETLARDVVFGTTDPYFASKGVALQENSPDEIFDAVVEMIDRLGGDFAVDGEIDRRFHTIGRAFEASLTEERIVTLGKGINKYMLGYGFADKCTNIAQSFCARYPDFLGQA